MPFLIVLIVLLLVFGIVAVVAPAILWPMTFVLGCIAVVGVVIYVIARLLLRSNGLIQLAGASVATCFAVLTVFSAFAAWSVDHDAAQWAEQGYDPECAESAADTYRDLQADALDPVSPWDYEQGESGFVQAVCG